MKFWQHDGLDGTFDAPIEHLVDQFRRSTHATTTGRDPVTAVRLFLTDTDGPISALWTDQADFYELCRRCTPAMTGPAS